MRGTVYDIAIPTLEKMKLRGSPRKGLGMGELQPIPESRDGEKIGHYEPVSQSIMHLYGIPKASKYRLQG